MEERDLNVQHHVIVQESSKSPAAEAFRALRTNLWYTKGIIPCSSVMFTSAGPGEGRSTTALNTAVALAQTGSKVFLLDCDLRKPMQHKLLNVAIRGFTNILIFDTKIDEVILETQIPNLYVIPCGPIPQNPSELLSLEKTRYVLSYLKTQTKYLIIDAPPVITVTDTCLLADQVEGVVMVINTNANRPEMIRQACNRLKNSNGNILGVVLNRVKIPAEYAHYYNYYEEAAVSGYK